MATVTRNIGSSVTMNTAGLTALAGSSTSVGWQSEKVVDTTAKAIDYQIEIAIAMGASAPGGDKCLYCYVVPWYYNDAVWFAPSMGTVINLSDSTTGGAVTIGVPNNNLGGPKVINYNVASEVVSTNFNLSNFVGGTMPDAWQLVLINNSTSTVIASTATFLGYKPIKFDVA